MKHVGTHKVWSGLGNEKVEERVSRLPFEPVAILVAVGYSIFMLLTFNLDCVIFSAKLLA